MEKELKMSKWEHILEKVMDVDALIRKVNTWKIKSESVVFTNGCFDIFHEGHAYIIAEAASKGDRLIIGLNADASVKLLKGEDRPINGEQSRARILASLLYVDAVVLFAEETPLNLIKTIQPDVLVKGGDYTIETIVGAKEVLDNGGSVEVIPLVEGKSSTKIINKVRKEEGGDC